MEESADYNRGFRDGFLAAQRPHAAPPPNLTGAPTMPPSLKCSKCGILFQGAVGYYCPQNDCPTFAKTTCVSYSNRETL
jgi:hypothetical protein